MERSIRPRPRGLKWGGARNRADRESDQLLERQCRQLIAAARHTLEKGIGFNRFITISWELGGITPEESVRATGRFIALARDWFRDRDEPLYWAWVQERGSTLGAHCHILLHVPEPLADLFGVMPLRWIKAILPKGAHRGGVLDTDRWRADHRPLRIPEALEAQIMGKVHYMLKAAPSELMAPLGMIGRGHVDWGRSCRVVGKRLAVSNSCKR